MESRQRLAVALRHQEPDKVPIDLGGFQTGIHYVAYKRLLDYLEIDDPRVKFYDYLQQLVLPCETLLERFEIDTRTVHLPGSFLPESADIEEREGSHVGFWDKFGIFWGRDPERSRRLFNPVVHPFADFKTAQQIREYNWPDGRDSHQFLGLREYAQNLHENTHYALIGRSMGCLFQWTHYLFGFDRAMRHLLHDPDLMTAAMEGLLEYFTRFATEYLDRVGDCVQTVQITSDLSGQSGPLLSPRLYRKMIKPIEAEFARRLHALADVKINYHCCGSPIAFMPDFVEIGYDALNPVQVSAYDMDPCSLKRRFGDQICYWGGACDPQHTLPFASPEDVKKEVRYNMKCLKPGGGFIAASVHNITYDVPPENIVALFDGIQANRSY